MGVDWSANLIFGYDLGFYYDIIESNPEWYDEEDEDFTDQIFEALLASVGFTDKWSKEDTTYWDRRKEAENKLGIQVYHYCSLYERDSTGYIIGTVNYYSYEDRPVEIGADDLTVDPAWIEMLDKGIKTLGLTPKNGKPAWLLSTLLS